MAWCCLGLGGGCSKIGLLVFRDGRDRYVDAVERWGRGKREGGFVLCRMYFSGGSGFMVHVWVFFFSLMSRGGKELK